MSVPVLFDTPDEAERAFYTAFEQADLEAMMQVWDDDEDVICIHPMGACLKGADAVGQRWREIFESGSPMRFEVTQRRFTRNETISVHCVTERIAHGRRLEGRSTVIATNVYKKTPFGWRMIVHHASPAGEEPDTQSDTLVRSGRLH
jgi:ketosteroid isomerase-like protein